MGNESNELFSVVTKEQRVSVLNDHFLKIMVYSRRKTVECSLQVGSVKELKYVGGMVIRVFSSVLRALLQSVVVKKDLSQRQISDLLVCSHCSEDASLLMTSSVRPQDA